MLLHRSLCMLVALVGALLAAPALAADDAAPLVLSNEHLDMTKAELAPPPPVEEVAEAPVEIEVLTLPSEPEPEVVEEAAPEVVEAVAEEEPEELWSFENEEGEPEVVAGPAEPEVTYAVCMERSIRAGNGYDESNRVCQAVFGAESL